jgi:hypothetical protein
MSVERTNINESTDEKLAFIDVQQLRSRKNRVMTLMMRKTLLVVSLLFVSFLCLGQYVEALSLPIKKSRNQSQLYSSLLANGKTDEDRWRLEYVGHQRWSTRRLSQQRSSRHEVTRRREFLLVQAALFGAVMNVYPAGASTASLPQQQPLKNNVFADNKNFSTEEATKRFLAAREDLKYLVENYAEITRNGNGDSVRNYLGTQGVNSNLYGIQKVLKVLTESADDIVEYTEAMEEFNAYYYQAEGAAYQSLFVEYSSAKGSPEMYLATAKQDILQMQKCMDRLAQQLNL